MSTSRLGTSKGPSGPNDLSKFREEVRKRARARALVNAREHAGRHA